MQPSEQNIIQHWDTVESGIPNVFLLRNRNFEKYFQTGSSHDTTANNSNHIDKNDKVFRRPEHWPKAWANKDIIWNSLGTLWADNLREEEEHPVASCSAAATLGDDSLTSIMIENETTTAEDSLSEPLLPEYHDNDCYCTRTVEDDFLLSPRDHDFNESERIMRRAFVVEEQFQKVRDDLSWDYLVVYFDPCLIEIPPHPSSPSLLTPIVDQNEGETQAEYPKKTESSTSMIGSREGGFFDGVCTVSFRKPKPKRKPQSKSPVPMETIEQDLSPYLVIGALATEKSLSDDENERVTKSMVGAVVELGKKMLADFVEKKQDSVWYRGFDATAYSQPLKNLLVCIAFGSQPHVSSEQKKEPSSYDNYLILNNEDSNNQNLDDKDAASSPPSSKENMNNIKDNTTLEILVVNSSNTTTDHEEEAEFLSFWKDKIGFQEASREVTLKVLGKYRTPFSRDYLPHCYNNKDDQTKEGNKKRKKTKSTSGTSFEDGAAASITLLSTSSSSSSSCTDSECASSCEDDDEKKSKTDMLLEEFASKIKLLVIH